MSVVSVYANSMTYMHRIHFIFHALVFYFCSVSALTHKLSTHVLLKSAL